MSDFIIDPKSISHADIRRDLMTYLNAQPDSESWAPFFQSGAGTNIIDILAGLGTFLKMEAIIARRESFIQFAKNRSSIVGHAESQGYSSFRGRNRVVKATIVPAVTTVLEKYEYIGTVRDRYLIVEEATVVNAGVPVSLNVIVGEVFDETKISSTAALNAFRFVTPNVSQDLRIFISGTEVEWTDTIEGMLKGKFCILSNPLGSVDAKYLNEAGFATRYNVGSPVKLQWIDLKEVDYEDSEVKLYEEIGTLTGMETVTDYQAIETNTSIIVKAPLQAETRNAVRGREDQPKIFRTLHPDILDATGIDISSAIMKIFVLRSNGYAFTPVEKQAMQDAFSPKRPHGLFPPYIEDADAAPIKLAINIVLKKLSLTVPNVLVDGILASYKNKLKVTLNLQDIEDNIENDAGVKVARVKIVADAWQSITPYRLGSYVSKNADNGKVYKVISLRNQSGSLEPTWPTEEHSEVDDYGIIWRAVPKTDLSGFTPWQATSFYSLNSIVRPITPNGYVYQAVGFRYHSDNTEPTWPTAIGEEIKDGRLVWIGRPIEGTVPQWEAATAYQKGDVVVPTGVTSPTIMFQAVGYTGRTGLTEPSFTTVTNGQFIDNELIWLTTNPEQTEHTLSENQYFVIDRTITVE